MTVTEEQNHYQTLGVAQEASAEEIKRAFRSLMRKYHPDVAGPEGQEVTTRVSEAYEVLSNDESRESYDRMLAGEPDPDAEPEEAAEYTEAWGQESDWEVPEEADEEGAGDPSVEEELDDVVEDVPPAPENRPAPDDQKGKPEYQGEREDSWPLADYPDPTFVYPARLAPFWAGGWGLGALLGAALVFFSTEPSGLSGSASKAVVLLVAIIAGSTLGAAATKRFHGTEKRWTFRRAIASGVGYLLLGLGAGLVTYSFFPDGMTIIGGGVAALLFTLSGSMVYLSMSRDQKVLNQFIETDSLKSNNCFGNLPGGVAADLLNTDLFHLFDIPSMRMLRSDDPERPFSHALLVEDRLVLVRAIQAPGGMFRWSGPSLLRQGSEGYPEEIMTGQYAQALADAQKAFPEGKVSSWLFVYSQEKVWGSPDPQHPTVTSPEEGLQAIGDFLIEGGTEQVLQQRVVEGMFALTG